MLRAAVADYRRQQQLVAAAVIAARKAWAFNDLPRLVVTITQLQRQAAQTAVLSVPAMLAEQRLTAPAAGQVDPAAFAGIASDGRTLAGLFTKALTSVALQRMAGTQVIDAARIATGVATVTRPQITGYVRMLGPSPCSRCISLAGKFYRWNTGFERHPLCMCRHIPTVEDVSGDIRTDPRNFFNSLSRVKQDSTFGHDGAQAIRDGADIAQVVNARRGMEVAAPFGKLIVVTREGVTKHGAAYKGFKDQTGRALKVRLMPEQIYSTAGDDRDEAIRLLKLHGYVKP